MQQWWLQPVVARLESTALFFGALGLTAITDNVALTYLGSLIAGLFGRARYIPLGCSFHISESLHNHAIAQVWRQSSATALQIRVVSSGFIVLGGYAPTMRPSTLPIYS